VPPATNRLRILSVAPVGAPAKEMVRALRAAHHVLSTIDDLEGAHSLLSSKGFDYVVLPAPTLVSLLEERALLESEDSEAWRRSVIEVTHDLQTTLSLLDGAVTQKEAASPGADWQEKLADAGRRLSVLRTFAEELIVELTNGSRDGGVDGGIDVQEVIETAAVSVYPMAQEKRQRLVIDIDEDVARIIADRTKVKRILSRLLDYSVRSTPALGTVSVHASSEEDNCLISVSGSGAGVTKAELNRLFSPDVPQRGYSVGLSLVKKVVEQLEGRLWIESEKGNGTTVFVTLPGLAKPSLATALRP